MTVKRSDLPEREKKPRIRPLGRTQVRKKHNYVNSKIPGVDPVEIKKSGQCVYTKEQLEEVRNELPTTIIDDDSTARYAQREKEVSQVEVLMLKGVTNNVLIAGVMGCSKQHAAGLVKSVNTRWGIHGGARNSSVIKGEAAAKLALLENEYWTLYSKNDTAATTKVNILANLVHLVDRKLLLHGLSPRVLENIAEELYDSSVIDAANENAMTASIRVKESLAQATQEAVKLIAQAGAVNEPTSN